MTLVRRAFLVLAGLLLALAGQYAVLWVALAIATSPAMDRFRNHGGSLGDLILILTLVLGLDAIVAGVVALVLRRRRVATLSVLAASALIAVVVILGFALW